MNQPAIDEDALAKHLPPVPRLVLGGMEIVPADSDPVAVPTLATRWCMPGGRITTTFDLLGYAKHYGVSLTIILNKESSTNER